MWSTLRGGHLASTFTTTDGALEAPLLFLIRCIARAYSLAGNNL